MVKVAFLTAFFIGLFFAFSWAIAFPGEFGTPPAPQNIQVNGAYAHYDVQIHNRDNPVVWDAPMAAQHTSACGAPPGTHTVHAMADSVFICNDHLMTAANAHGYGEIMITPSQVVNCSAGCTVQWEMSTERMSGRDWPDVWLTPWDDNMALPLAPYFPDLQGFPRRGITATANPGQNSWLLQTINNYQHTDLNTAWWVGMHEGIQAGVNQSATRQTFKLTVVAGAVKFERLPSATATGIVWTLDVNGNPGFTPCACLLASDYVVQFGHHSYTPEKDGAGIPATWHWSNFTLTPSTPFTLIHTSPSTVTANNTLVTFNAPAPANARLRFAGICKVFIDGVQAPWQTHIRADGASSYFMPIAQGKQSVSVSFAPDDWYGGPCNAKDFHVWSKGGTPSTPTPVLPTMTPTSVPTALPSPSSTPLVSPTISVPTATLTPVVVPTATPVIRQCTLRWGGNTIENYGLLTQEQCAARGN